MYLKPLVVWTDATFRGMFCFQTRRVSNMGKYRWRR